MLIVEGRDLSDNLNSFTTDSFTILYTNWNSDSKNRVGARNNKCTNNRSFSLCGCYLFTI